MCFCVAVVHSTSFIFLKKNDVKLYEHHSASIHVCGDFSIHHKGWLIYSNKTGEEGRYYQDFPIVDEHTAFPIKTGYHAKLLDHFHTFCPEKFSAELLPPLCPSDHSLVSVKVVAKPKAFHDVPFHRTIFRFL